MEVSKPAKIKVLLADDHEVVRKGLRLVLEMEADLEVIGEASNGLEVLEEVQVKQPDIVLLDLMMPRLNGIEVTKHLNNTFPEIKIIIFSFYANESYVLEALKAGVKGYVLKGSPISELLRAIREVIAGRRYLDPKLSQMAIDTFLLKLEPGEADPYNSLSSREKEILQLVAQGHTNTEIANKLFISRRTVEIHRANVMRKLGLRPQYVQLVQYAHERGILPSIAGQESAEDKEKPLGKKGKEE
jgi:DNA-binding NarL/FixJ family response regulator